MNKLILNRYDYNTGKLVTVFYYRHDQEGMIWPAAFTDKTWESGFDIELHRLTERAS